MAAQTVHSKPLRWLVSIAILLAGCVAVAAANAIACDQYAKWSRHDALPTAKDALQHDARILEGRLCMESTGCAPAALVRGIMTAETIEAIYARAAIAMPGNLWVCFQSPGGSHAISAVGQLPENVKTCVVDVADVDGKRSSGLCASACSWIWLAGRERRLLGANHVGFHRPYLHDAPACAPGNILQGVVALSMAFFRDNFEHGFSEQERAVRHELRLRGMSRAPNEVYALRAAEAHELGLISPKPSSEGVFLVGQAANQAVAGK